MPSNTSTSTGTTTPSSRAGGGGNNNNNNNNNNNINNIRRPLRVGMIGGGTVGGGVYELLIARGGGGGGNDGIQSPKSQQQQIPKKNLEGGTGVAEDRRIQNLLRITKICVQDLSKPRSFHLEDYTTMTTNVDSILKDPDIDLVVEVMGETTVNTAAAATTTTTSSTGKEKQQQPQQTAMNSLALSKRIIETALKQNKYVVTANSSLLAEYLQTFEPLLYQNNKFGYEATVCCGIPIIQILQSSYTGDVIHQIQAICNGTTNFMLGRMEDARENYTFDDIFQEALDLGYTTTQKTQKPVQQQQQQPGSPSTIPRSGESVSSELYAYNSDIEGYDARAKICILAKLAFGVTVPIQEVPCKGISELTKVDFEYANLMNCTIKLIGTAQRLHEAREWDGPLCVFVTPVMIPKSHILANVKGKTNAVAVTSANMGTCSYTGPGAGRFPAANSVVADMVRLATGKHAVPPFPNLSSTVNHHHHNNNNNASSKNSNNNIINNFNSSASSLGSSTLTTTSTSSLELDHDYTSTFYIRIPYSDGLGIIKRVGELAEHAGVSIHSILQNPIRDRESADFVVTTEEAKVSQVTEFCELINEEQDFCRAPCVFMPMLVTEEDSLYE